MQDIKKSYCPRALSAQETVLERVIFLDTNEFCSRAQGTHITGHNGDMFSEAYSGHHIML